jgi:hypothetical protein
MLIGYARVSTSEQETAAQAAALKVAGCERIYREKASGGRWDRPELLFLEINGYRFAANEEDATQAVMGLAAGAIDEPAFAAWRRANARREPPAK